MRFPKKGLKYGNAMAGGSKLEESVYQTLLLREKAGEIRDIERQSTVWLSPKRRWRVDFSFTKCSTGERVWCEAKGPETDRYLANRSAWEYPMGPGPGQLEIWKGDYRRPQLVEIINPKERCMGPNADER